MMPVTDPGLINQLESTTQQPQPVSDPNLIAQLEQQSSSQSAIPGANYLPPGIKDVLSGLATGGQNINQFLTNDIAKPIVRQFSPSLASKLGATPINPDQLFGVNNPDLIDKLVKGVAQYAPVLPALGASVPAIAAGGAYGATQAPDHPIAGATIGAATAAIPGAISFGAKALNAIRPQKYAESIINDLSGGRSLEQNAQSLAQDIKNAYQQRLAEGNAFYNKVTDTFGNNPIYNRIDPILGFSQKGNYEMLGNSVTDNMSGDLASMHANFLQNPTLNNAHQLQSQLGSEIGTLQFQKAKGLLDKAGKNSLSALSNARGALQSDINSYLSSQGIQPVSDYIAASNNWRQNVVPYLSNPKLAQISTGKITNPGNISNIFKNPEDSIKKVISDLPQDSQNKIIYSALGKSISNVTPENLSSAITGLDKKGLNSYVTPTLQQQFNNLAGKIAGRKIATFGTGKYLSTAYRAAKQSAPISQLGSGISSSVGAAYPYVSQETIANMLNQYFNGGRQQ